MTVDLKYKRDCLNDVLNNIEDSLDILKHCSIDSDDTDGVTTLHMAFNSVLDYITEVEMDMMEAGEIE